MSRSIVITLFLAGLLCGLPGFSMSGAGSLPPYPLMTTRVQPSTAEAEKAEALFFLARRENRRLGWDACLARKAFRRAKAMVEQRYFAHENPENRGQSCLGNGDAVWPLSLRFRKPDPGIRSCRGLPPNSDAEPHARGQRDELQAPIPRGWLL